MSTPNTITVAGNLTADPDFKMTSGEVPLARIRVAVSRRSYVKESDSWEDRHDGFFTVVCWREMARHVHASLKKGDRIVVSGRLSHREYEARVEGDDDHTETRSVVEIEADEIGGSMRWHSWARLQKREVIQSAEESDAVAPAA